MKRSLLSILLFLAVSAGAFAQPPQGRVPLRERIMGSLRAEIHVVNRGETTYSIARRYEVTLSELIEANPGFDPERLSIGQRVRVPRRAIGTATVEQIDADFARHTDADTVVIHVPPPVFDGVAPVDTILFDDPFAHEYDEGWGWGSPHLFDPSRPLRVALMLPFTDADGHPEASMADYYRGTLLGLEDVKADGASVDLSVFDTREAPDRVEEFLREIEEPDLIIGPREGAEFDQAARFARRHGIPIVSPQSLVEGGNPFVYQARPAPEYQYEKLKPFFTDDHNVVLIVPAGGDAEFIAGIEPGLPLGTRRIDYAKTTLAGNLNQALSRERENVIVVPTTTENMTNEILAIVSSVQNNITATTGRGYALQVIGSGQWARFQNNDRELFFKLQAMYPTLYYADRTNAAVAEFGRRYLEAFGQLPSLFSYRGYDVAKIFVTALHRYGGDYDRSINRAGVPPLQVEYRFEPDFTGKRVNDRWVLVRYFSDYRIGVE